MVTARQPHELLLLAAGLAGQAALAVVVHELLLLAIMQAVALRCLEADPFFRPILCGARRF